MMAKGKTSLKSDKAQVKHEGQKVRLFQLDKAMPRSCERCSKPLGSGKMVVRLSEAFYCGWGCSDG